MENYVSLHENMFVKHSQKFTLRLVQLVLMAQHLWILVFGFSFLVGLEEGNIPILATFMVNIGVIVYNWFFLGQKSLNLLIIISSIQMKKNRKNIENVCFNQKN